MADQLGLPRSPRDILVPPAKVMDSAAFLTRLFTRDATDRAKAFAESYIETVMRLGNEALEIVGPRRYTQRLTEQADQEKLAEAIVLKSVGEGTNNQDLVDHQTRVIAVIRARNLARHIQAGDPMYEDRLLGLKHALHELPAPPEESIKTLGLERGQFEAIAPLFGIEIETAD